jgi:hypothetical protein
VDLEGEPREKAGRILADAAQVALAGHAERDRGRLLVASSRLHRARLLAPNLDLVSAARNFRWYLECPGRADLALVVRPHWWVEKSFPPKLDALDNAPANAPDLGGEWLGCTEEHMWLHDALDHEEVNNRQPVGAITKFDAYFEALLFHPEIDGLWGSVGNEAIALGQDRIGVACAKVYYSRRKGGTTIDQRYADGQLGGALLHLGRYKDAVPFLEETWDLSKGPQDCDGWVGCTWIYSVFGTNDWEKLDKAIADVKQNESGKASPTQTVILIGQIMGERAKPLR